ncbi:MAG: ComEA family DNA-binding protein, partial [Candidatus Margulisiibacteriota bacterium]
PTKTSALEVKDDQGRDVAGKKININTADEKALDSLPGVGKATAQAIIEYRKTNGPFTRLEQIMEIPRFGKSKFEKIKNRITL